MKDFSKFEEKIGIVFANKELLRQAFTHRSYINENHGVVSGHNERLEFLGDAVLELVTTEELFEKFPNKSEGELTSIRAAMVNTNSISEAAKKMGADDFLLLSKGEAKDTGKARGYILANTFEAIVGAIYVDSGYANSRKFIAQALFGQIDQIIKNKSYIDSKSLVQEKAQEVIGVTPSYGVLSETGPDHDKNFTIGIYFGDEKIAEGKGKSKQEAEQDAARNALLKKKWI
jgi:ribonuclease-3